MKRPLVEALPYNEHFLNKQFNRNHREHYGIIRHPAQGSDGRTLAELSPSPSKLHSSTSQCKEPPFPHQSQTGEKQDAHFYVALWFLLLFCLFARPLLRDSVLCEHVNGETQGHPLAQNNHGQRVSAFELF